ncbi:hypothetical protein [Alkalimarinus alittae]|uniref:Uncharacterized protein n=1 Tax=Alkalimarinus alittae TaxID=2961619 RepID=A0ABY6MY92_9ALTE|nr:hypothetical protein [Alkalimarinus alittae]UZE94811.1 hypothetical protein NKI27_12055 [Alkalimarinus alittae]
MFSCDADKTLNMSVINQYGGDWKGSMTCWPDISFTPELRYTDDPFSADITIAVALADDNAKKWSQRIPADLVPRLIAFEQIWLGNAYITLFFISRSESARNLFTSNMGLFWYIIKHCNSWHPLETLQLFNERKKKILSFLGLPEEPAVFNTFKKLNLLKPDNHVVNALTTVMKSGTYKALLHVKFLTEDLINLLAKYPDLSSSKLIQRYQPSWEYFSFSDELSTITESAEDYELGVKWVATKLTGNNPQVVLERIDERITHHFRNKSEVSQRKKPNCSYPKPPVEGNDHIKPISKYYDILRESEEQEHCVQNYHEMVLDGSTYFYKITRPQRATIQLNVEDSGKIYLEDIKLKHNTTPSAEIEHVIYEWLLSSKKGIDLERYQYKLVCESEDYNDDDF